MRVYADTSFLVKLLTHESGTEAAVAEYRRLGRPPLFFLPLHGLEVTNAIRQRAFHRRHTDSAIERSSIRREREAALALLEKYFSRRAFIDATVDMEVVIARARQLSEKHTERIGCRGFDLLHVAAAVELGCNTFLTTDRVQGKAVEAEGLVVTVSQDD